MLGGKHSTTTGSKIKSFASLLAVGLVVVFAPYIAFAICSPTVLFGLGGAISSMSISGMLITVVTYMCADFLSNFLQHPVHKMDYGAFNRLIGRDVGSAWWGTRYARTAMSSAGGGRPEPLHAAFPGIKAVCSTAAVRHLFRRRLFLRPCKRFPQ
jgi:hypothetical protein